MKKLYILLFFLSEIFFVTNLYAQINNDTVKNLQSDFNNFRKEASKEFSGIRHANSKAFNKFEQDHKKAFEAFKSSVTKKWGENNFVSSDKVDWVEYSKDKNLRSKVNFKEGIAQVEILVPAVDAKNKSLIEDKLKNAVKFLALNHGKTLDYPVGKIRPERLSKEPILSGMLKTKKGKVVSSGNVSEYADEVIAEHSPVIKEVTGTDNSKRIELSINIPLEKNYLATSVKRVLPYVEEFANKYKVEPALILAVIHAESYFNPKAVSSSNAIGLMQLVPTSGGREAYYSVYGKNIIPNWDYLMKPQNNIRLGSAYLHILLTKYYGGVFNDNSKRYCSIAAYNTGPGNVNLAIAGTKDIYKAVNSINLYQQQPVSLYNKLENNLPYMETRNYLEKVNDLYLFYKKAISVK